MSPKFQLGAHVYGLVHARDILLAPDDVAVARDRLTRMDGLDEHTLRRVLDDNGLLPLSFRVGDDLFELLARAWVHRLITVIEHRQPARQLDGPGVRNLVPPRALGELPTGPTPGPDPGKTTPTWVSFEVVDDQGNLVDGAFRCQLDARLEAGELEQMPHRFEELERGASAQVYLEMLRWPAEPLGGPVVDPAVDPIVDPIVDDVDDVGDDVPGGPGSAHDTQVTTFVVVDEQGDALTGTARWTDDGGKLVEVELGGRLELLGSKAVVKLSIDLN